MASKKIVRLCLFFAIIIPAHAALAQSPPPENTGPNINVVREVTGKLTFRTLSDQRHRGGEDFRLIVYPDGSRQIFISKDFKAVNAQQTMIARVDKRFRPLQTFASYWTRDGFKGAIFVTIDGNQLQALADGPKGRTMHSRKVPDKIAIVHHGEVMNGWYMWPDFAAPSSGQQTISTYNLNAAPRSDAQVSGVCLDSVYSRLGNDSVTTPAGTFDTTHYQLSGGAEPLDIWIGTEDHLLVRQIDTKNDREYLLTEIRATQSQ